MSKNSSGIYSYLGKENRSLFLDEAFQGGESLFYHGNVQITYKEDSDYKQEIHANVKGEDGESYAVRLDLLNHLIKKADCSCSYKRSGFCKHIAATLVALGKEEEEKKGGLSFYRSLNLIIAKNKDSISSLLDKSFERLNAEIVASSLSEEEIIEGVLFIYKNLTLLTRLNVNLLGSDAFQRISTLPLSDKGKKSLFDHLYTYFYENGAKAFLLSALENEQYHSLALDAFFQALEKKDYRFFCFFFSSEEKESLLSSLRDEELKRLALSPFSIVFYPTDILEEMKRREDPSLCLSFLANRYENYDASFNLELGNILKRAENPDYLKAYKNVLTSRGLTLFEFVDFYHSLEEKERLIFLPMFEMQAYYRGYEGAYRFLKAKDESLLKKFSLKEWAALANDIINSHLLYDTYLKRKIEAALGSKNITPDIQNSLEIIMGTYPLTVIEPYLNDSRFVNLFKSSGTFGDYLRLLEKTSTLEEFHYCAYKE